MSDQVPTATREEAQPNGFERYFRAVDQKQSAPPARRPWLLATLALVCAALVVVGSLGPWRYYERVSMSAPDSWTLYGVRTDGAFTLLFACVAIVALLAAFFRPSAADIAWVAFGALALCAVTGLAGWLIFAPPERSVVPGEVGNIERVEWGNKLVGLAGAVGALVTFFVARQLNRD